MESFEKTERKGCVFSGTSVAQTLGKSLFKKPDTVTVA